MTFNNNKMRSLDLDDGCVLKKRRLHLHWRVSKQKERFSSEYTVVHGVMNNKYVEYERGIAKNEFYVTTESVMFNSWNTV